MPPPPGRERKARIKMSTPERHASPLVTFTTVLVGPCTLGGRRPMSWPSSPPNI